MTKPASTNAPTQPPSPELLGLPRFRKRDYLRLAWWLLRAFRYIWPLPFLALGLVGVAFLWLSPLLGMGLWGLACSIPVGLLVLYLLTVFAWWLETASSTSHIYMGKRAVLVLEQKGRTWRIKQHFSSRIGKQFHYGADFRADLVPKAQAYADTHALPGELIISGKAQNRKVLKLYLKQLSTFGFRRENEKMSESEQEHGRKRARATIVIKWETGRPTTGAQWRPYPQRGKWSLGRR